jgi:DNA-binding NtrC family response regulator
MTVPDRTVLVVDQDGVWRAALRSWLEREGYRVLGIGRGDGAASAIESQRVDVVILDVHSPDRDDLEVLGEIRRRWPSLPVIVTTVFGGAQTGDIARRRGATGHLDKPFRLADLVAEIHRAAGPCGQGRGCTRR